MSIFTAGIGSLVLAYMLSQFYRAFLAVLSPVLEYEIGAAPGDLALSSGLWFLAFAAMQIPVGAALDRIGPRRTVAWALILGGAVGAAVFALATAPWHLHLSMALLGIGCSPALMGSYYIFARDYPPAAFGTLTSIVIGFGALGNILGATPLVWVIEAAGWRQTLWGLALVTLSVALLVLIAVRDPARLGSDQPKGSLSELLRLRALWFLLPLLSINYAASAAVRGLWAAPYMQQVHGADTQLIGRVTLVMGLGMVIGNFLVGPAARLVGSVRRLTLISTAITIGVMAVLWLRPASDVPTATLLMAMIGLSGAAYPMIMAHGRAFLPAHLVGRGMTFLNMIAITGVGITQFASRAVYDAASAAYPPAQAFAMLWLFFLIPLAIGFALYVLTPEPEHV
jgi:predicted MFS family arabinose efflux permease